MKIQKLFLFILLILFSSESKAIALATLPSTLSDTCVEISLKSGSKIIAKITRKTPEKVYFRKCDNLADTTSYFVLQEKINNIRTYDGEAKEFQENKSNSSTEEENKAKRNRIWGLLVISLLSILLMRIPGVTNLGLSTLLISSIWGLIEVASYKGKFEGKGLAAALFMIELSLFFLLFLFIIIIILNG